MRFTLVDRLVEWESGRSLRSVKNLTTAEEYLADHFPSFPVMPGVLMLQVLVESAAWLLRISSNFQHSIIALRDVRNVKYGAFMEPGKSMEVKVEWVKQEGSLTTFKGKGMAEGGAQTANAQFSLAAYNLAERNPAAAALDAKLIAHWRERFFLLTELMGKK